MVSEKRQDAWLKLLVQSDHGGKLTVTVKQEADGMVWMYNKDGACHVGAITPHWIAEIAHMAMQLGWSQDKATPFSLGFVDGKLVTV